MPSLKQLLIPPVPSFSSATEQYSSETQNQNLNVLRLFFTKLTNGLSTLMGRNGGSYINTPYGAFQSLVDQTIASANTAYAMTLDTTDYSNGVTLSNSSRMNVKNTGVYNFQWSGQFVNNDSQLHDVSVWIRKNGTDVVGSTGFISIPNSHGGVNGHSIVGWNYFLELAANDYIELWWSATSTTVSLQFLPTQTSPTRPSTASLITTMNFVSTVAT
jgi:hypothetical protein